MVVWNTVSITANAATGSTYMAMRGTRRIFSATPSAKKRPLAHNAAPKPFSLRTRCAWRSSAAVPRRAITTGPNRSCSSCAAPGKAIDAIFLSKSLPIFSRRRSPCCKQRPVRMTAYSAEKPMAYSVSPTMGAMALCSSLCHSFSQRCWRLRRILCRRSTPRHWSCAHSERSFWRRDCRTGCAAGCCSFVLSSVNGIFSFLRRCRAFFRPGTQQLDSVRSPVQKANRACTQYALFLLYTLHGLKQALT